MNFAPALAYHFCLNLPAAFTQPGARLLVEPCISPNIVISYLLSQSVDYNGQEGVGGVELEEVHRVVEGVCGPVGVDGEEELAGEAGHVLVEGVLHEDRQAAVEPVAVNQERPLEVHELKRKWVFVDMALFKNQLLP